MSFFYGTFLLFLLITTSSSSHYVNKGIERVFELRESVVICWLSINIDKTIPNTPYELDIEEYSPYLGFIEITDKKSYGKNDVLPYERSGDKIYINNIISTHFEVFMILGDFYQLIPKKIHYLQNQRLRIDFNEYITSQYQTNSFTTRVKTINNQQGKNDKSYFNPPNQKTVYSHKNIKPNTSPSWKYVSIGHNYPLPMFEKAYQRIEMSLFGNIAIYGEYSLVNRAAGLSGEFTRVPFSYRAIPEHVLQKIKATVPRFSRNLDYRDHIGNISSSRAYRKFVYDKFSGKKQSSYLSIDVSPRYPMFGEWKSYFEFSFNQPGRFILSESSSSSSFFHKDFIANISIDHPFPVIYSSEYKMDIVLPPLSSNIQISSPIPLKESVVYSTKWGWLDLLYPQKIVSLNFGKFVLPEKLHFNAKLQVAFSVPNSIFYTWMKPILLSLYVFILFLSYIIFNRVKLIISSKKENEQVSCNERKSYIVEQLFDIFEDIVHSLNIGDSKTANTDAILFKTLLSQLKQVSTGPVDKCSKSFENLMASQEKDGQKSSISEISENVLSQLHSL